MKANNADMDRPFESAFAELEEVVQQLEEGDLSLEQAAWEANHRRVAGIDEAGRGAWAGPVVAAAVILPADSPDLSLRLAGVRDSKLCTPLQRERLYEIIQSEAVSIGVGLVQAEKNVVVLVVQPLHHHPVFALDVYHAGLLRNRI